MSNSGSMAQLMIAAQGWQHDGWQERFYPEDMPSEWQLGYYANEFRAVLVAPPATQDEVARWCDDVDAEFGFCLDLRQTRPDTELIAAFGEQLLGVLVSEIPDIVPEQAGIFSDLQESEISLPNSEESRIFDDVSGNGMRLCLYRAEPALTLAGLREDIEALLQDVPPESCCIMTWCDEPPPLEIMQQAKMIAEFMGA